MHSYHCIFYISEEETSFHLLVSCQFSIYVWKHVASSSNCSGICEGKTLSECFLSWNEHEPDWKSLPCYISRELWKGRNKRIFENSIIDAISISYKGITTFKEDTFVKEIVHLISNKEHPKVHMA